MSSIFYLYYRALFYRLVLIFQRILKHILNSMLKRNKLNYVQYLILRKQLPNCASFPRATFSSVSLLTGITRGGRHRRRFMQYVQKLKNGQKAISSLSCQGLRLKSAACSRLPLWCLLDVCRGWNPHLKPFKISKEKMGHPWLDYLALPSSSSPSFIRTRAWIWLNLSLTSLWSSSCPSSSRWENLPISLVNSPIGLGRSTW